MVNLPTIGVGDFKTCINALCHSFKCKNYQFHTSTRDATHVLEIYYDKYKVKIMIPVIVYATGNLDSLQFLIINEAEPRDITMFSTRNFDKALFPFRFEEPNLYDECKQVVQTVKYLITGKMY